MDTGRESVAARNYGEGEILGGAQRKFKGNEITLCSMCHHTLVKTQECAATNINYELLVMRMC